MTDRTRILIADDEASARQRVRRALEKSSRFEVVAEAADGATAWDALVRLRPDIAIIDIGMPVMDGMALARRARRAGLAVDIVFLTVCAEQAMFDAALALGMKGYLLKHYTGDEILSCLEAVSAGELCASPPVVTHIVEKMQGRADRAPDVATELTMQERAILRRIRQQKSSKEIAGQLGVSVRTIETHRANICKKLGIKGNYGLSRYALDHVRNRDR
jgi:DNA-binding NarL/FixJ family response regulator